MIEDIKDLTEKIEEINGKYSKAMDDMKMFPERKEEFFSLVKDIFRAKMDVVKEVEPLVLYDFIIREHFFEVKRMYRNFVSKHNKKIVRNRGNVIWNGNKGTFKREK